MDTYYNNNTVISFENLSKAIAVAELNKNYEPYSRLESGYDEVITEAKRVVNHMSNAFDRMKAANEWKRTRINDTGNLNLRKLHQYKYCDDIFTKGESIATGKNHGIVMFVDFSSSMRNVISEEINQIITTAMFAKKVGIPFEAYSFTSGNTHSDVIRSERYLYNSTPRFDHSFTNVCVVELINSNLPKKDFEKGLFNLYATGKINSNIYCSNLPAAYRLSTYQNMGGTPLVEAFIIAEKIVDRFVKKYDIEIPTFISITDGAGRNTSLENIKRYPAPKVNSIMDNNHIYSSNFTGNNDTVKIVTIINEMIREKHGANIIGYFVANNKSDYNSFERIFDHTANKKYGQIGKDGFYQANIESYDEFFVISGNNVDEDHISSADSIKDISKKFRKNSANAKNSRVFANKVIEVVAVDA